MNKKLLAWFLLLLATVSWAGVTVNNSGITFGSCPATSPGGGGSFTSIGQ